MLALQARDRERRAETTEERINRLKRENPIIPSFSETGARLIRKAQHDAICETYRNPKFLPLQKPDVRVGIGVHREPAQQEAPKTRMGQESAYRKAMRHEPHKREHHGYIYIHGKRVSLKGNKRWGEE